MSRVAGDKHRKFLLVESIEIYVLCVNLLEDNDELNRILGEVTDEHLETITKESGSTADGNIRGLTSERQVPAMLDEVAEGEYGVLHTGWGSHQEPTPGNYNNHDSHSCSFEHCVSRILIV